MPQRFYGRTPDTEDDRDYLLELEPTGAPPSSCDLRTLCPPVYDQGQLGSCTAQAIAGNIEFDQIAQKMQESTPSRLFIYYNERVIEGSTANDAGASIRDGLKTVSKQGACHESKWPYDISKFAEEPPKSAYDDALTHTVSPYYRLRQNLWTMKTILARGRPFVFGITVYDSFESQQATDTGDIPMPDTNNESVLGGHALLAVGYDDSQGVFLFRNSWGASWGSNGYGTIPFAYLIDTSLSSDFWMIKDTK